MKVSDILKTKKRAGSILSVNAADEIAAAVAKMVENDTGSVVVYNAEKRFMGMLTFREVLIALHGKGYGAGSHVSCGEMVDTEHPYCATPDDTVDQIRSIMTGNHIRYLPVVQDGEPTDVISFYDVARTIVKAANYENRLLKEYIRNWPEQSGAPEESEE
ncbi:MAG: CBS domain-containing protein [Betaproteobacteria bacterium]|nr:CBS domain-containing protein [Betaproteobacteria bacterium]